MAEILGIDHVQLAMPPGEEEAARHFFVGVLGMAEVAKPAHLADNGGCWFEAGAAHIHLGAENGHVPARKAHPALLVDDLQALRRKLSAVGVDFVPGKPLDGYIRGDIADPFGNRIELMQRIAEPGGPS